MPINVNNNNDDVSLGFIQSFTVSIPRSRRGYPKNGQDLTGCQQPPSADLEIHVQVPAFAH